MSYSIVGADEREYGPVEIETLTKWAIEGRVVERTQIRDHATGRRFLACDVAELSAVFNLPPADIAPAPVSQPIIPSYTSYPPAPYYAPVRSRIVAGILGILFGWLGVHRFYLGYTGIGVVQLLMGTVLIPFTCGMSIIAAAIWGAVEGIMCLVGAMRDANGNPLTI